jgi:hypothetical protein
MKSFIRSLLALTLVSLFTVRCDTEIGNSRSTGFAIVGINDTTPSPQAMTVPAGGVNLTKAEVVVSHFKFRPIEFCSSHGGSNVGNDIIFQGPFVADLLTNTVQPPVGSASIPNGTYCQIEAEFDNSVVSSNNHAITILGETPTNHTPFQFTVDTLESLELENENGFEMSPSFVAALILSFNMTTWFSSLPDPLDSLTPEMNGTILIDANHNQADFGQIVKNIQLSAQLFRDDNQNGILDANEHQSGDELCHGILP